MTAATLHAIGAAVPIAVAAAVAVAVDWPNLVLNLALFSAFGGLWLWARRGSEALDRTSRRLSIDSLGEDHRLPYWRISPGYDVTTAGGDLGASGYKPGEVAGRPIWEWAPPGSDAEAGYRRAVGERETAVFDVRFPAKSGSPLVWRVRCDPTPDGGALARGVDVTDLVAHIDAAEADCARLAEKVEMLRSGQARIRQALDSDLGIAPPDGDA